MKHLARSILALELSRWRRLGQQPVLWWRDDDALQPTAALDRLLDLAGDLPLSLAIVPGGDLEGLARRLAQARNLTVSQHGIDHCNRRPPGAAPNEYPEGTTVAVVAQQIGAARLKMEKAGLTPRFYAPPWNQIDEILSDALCLAGFSSLSAAQDSRRVDNVTRIDSHLDILRWKPRSRFRGQTRVTLSLARLLRRRRRAGNYAAPIGLLTHHLAHDEPAWSFLAWFLGFAHSRFAWRSFEELAAAARSRQVVLGT